MSLVHGLGVDGFANSCWLLDARLKWIWLGCTHL